jgi:hypothetical protein
MFKALSPQQYQFETITLDEQVPLNVLSAYLC